MMDRSRVLAVSALALAGCATVPLPNGTVRTGVVVDGTRYDAEWALPDAQPRALLVLEHGFARRCANLRTTAARIAREGLLVLCVDASMTGGNGVFASALAQALAADALRAPDGDALPRRIAVGGHSAGGLFAVRLGAALAATVPERLAGLLLLDPVAGDGFDAGLQAVSAGDARPVLAVVAAPSRCNANGNAAAALAAVPATTRRIEGSSHGDAEGDDTDALLVAACGRPQPAAVAALREAAARWAAAVNAPR